jgi:guanylate kinase
VTVSLVPLASCHVNNVGNFVLINIFYRFSNTNKNASGPKAVSFLVPNQQKGLFTKLEHRTNDSEHRTQIVLQGEAKVLTQMEKSPDIVNNAEKVFSRPELSRKQVLEMSRLLLLGSGLLSAYVRTFASPV